MDFIGHYRDETGWADIRLDIFHTDYICEQVYSFSLEWRSSEALKLWERNMEEQAPVYPELPKSFDSGLFKSLFVIK